MATLTRPRRLAYTSDFGPAACRKSDRRDKEQQSRPSREASCDCNQPARADEPRSDNQLLTPEPLLNLLGRHARRLPPRVVFSNGRASPLQPTRVQRILYECLAVRSTLESVLSGL